MKQIGHKQVTGEAKRLRCPVCGLDLERRIVDAYHLCSRTGPPQQCASMTTPQIQESFACDVSCQGALLLVQTHFACKQGCSRIVAKWIHSLITTTTNIIPCLPIQPCSSICGIFHGSPPFSRG